MSVGVAKVHAAPTAAMVDLHIFVGVRPATIDEAFCPNAREDRIELRFTNLESIVMTRDAIAVGKIQCQRVVDFHRREVSDRAFVEWKSHNPREELCRRDLVVRWNDSVIEFNRHNKPPNLLYCLYNLDGHNLPPEGKHRAKADVHRVSVRRLKRVTFIAVSDGTVYFQSYYLGYRSPYDMSSIDLENSDLSSRSAADRLLMLLKTRGPQTAADLGAVLSITGEAARQQLLKLAGDGLVEATAEVRGVGRPSQVWRLTAPGHARFPDTHAELTVQLIHTVKTVLGEGVLERLITAREQETCVTYRAALEGAVDLRERVARLSAIRNREGYMAEWRVEGDSYLLIENHCPICAAATACQGLCRTELELFREVLGAETTVARVDHILAGARRCAYRIARTDADAQASSVPRPKRRQAAPPVDRHKPRASRHKRRG